MYLWAAGIQLCKIGNLSIGRQQEKCCQATYAVATKYPRESMRLGGYNTVCQVDESLFPTSQNMAEEGCPGIADSTRTPAVGYMEICLIVLKEHCCRLLRELPLLHLTNGEDISTLQRAWFGAQDCQPFIEFRKSCRRNSCSKSYWAKQKLRIKSMKGVMGERLDEYLLEFMWRDIVGNDVFNNLINILKI